MQRLTKEMIMSFHEEEIMDVYDKDLKEAFDKLEGAVIKKVGGMMVDRAHHLAIDYEKCGVPGRLIFGYNEFGLWKYWQGERGKLSVVDDFYKRLAEFMSNVSAEVSLEENAMRLTYTLTDGENSFEMSAKQLKCLPDNDACNRLRCLFSKKERDADDIFEALAGVYAQSPFI